MTSVRFPLILIAAAVVAAVLFGALVRSVRADEETWQTDFKTALDKAKKEKKYLLVDFTGSDWCGWCIKLHNEVFDKEPFKTDAPKQYVLVELDYPHQKKQPEELKKQNAELSDKYKIEGFPTVLLMDAEGQVIARTGYRDGGPEKYLKHLAEFGKIYENVVALKGKLNSVQGLARAKLLDEMVEGYKKLGNESDEVTGWCKEIIALDPDNKAGLKVKYEFPIEVAEAEKLASAGKMAEAKERLDKALTLKGVPAEMRQEGLMTKAGICESEGKFVDVIAALKAAKEAAPRSQAAAHLDELIEHFRKPAEAEAAVLKLEAALPTAKDLDRAKLLDKIITAKEKLPENETTVQNIVKWTDEIIAIDADNKAGLKTKYQFLVAYRDARNLANAEKIDGAAAALDKALTMPGLGGEELQKGLVFKAWIAHERHDSAQEISCFKKALAAAPESDLAPQVKQMIQRLEKGEKGEE
jgi:thioredoxin-related protein